jgi:hypothetical protein
MSYFRFSTKTTFGKVFQSSNETGLQRTYRFAKARRVMWAELDSNQRTRERTDLQSVAFSHSAICPQFNRAENWSRTSDLLITNQLLYQLSYFGL